MTKAPTMRILSANGSMIRPKRVTAAQRRARKPSRASVPAASAKEREASQRWAM